jgi:thioesterase domain-containing protein
LPGIDGHFLNFRDLAAALEKDCNVFGLEPIGLLPDDDSPCSFEQLAEQQVARLLSAQPTGTYHIAGFSFGGVLAYEMAQQLWRAGCSVSLSMIDATPGVPLPASTLQSLAFHGKYLSTLPWRDWLPYVQERIRAGRLAVLHRMGLISLHEKIRRIIDLDADYGRVAASNMQALVDYCPQASLGPATLYRAQIRASGGSGGDATAGWSEYFADYELTVLEVPGAHANMLAKTQVSRLANLLRASLATRS